MDADLKTRRIKLIASVIVTLAIMALIFAFSAQTGEGSGSLSSSIAQGLLGIFVPGFADMSAAEQAALIDDISWPIRKTAHAAEYFMLAVSAYMSCWQARAYRLESKKGRGGMLDGIARLLVIAFAIAAFYACTDEFHQLFVDGRAGMVTDVLVDCSGALIGAVLATLTSRWVCLRRQARRGDPRTRST